MHLMGYGIIVLAVIAGYFKMPVGMVAGLALIASLLFAETRRGLSKEKTLKPNPFVDGIYLFFMQFLMLFAAYLIGYFAATEAGDAFMKFVTGDRS